MTLTESAPTHAELQRMVDYVSRPISPDFAVNRYPQDVLMLVRHILTLRREQAELLRVLHTLPLDDVQPADTPLAIVEKAQAFWLDYQQGLWGERETARLKKAKERAEQQIETGRERESKLLERIAGLEAAYTDTQTVANDLHATIRELTNNLARATNSEAQVANRVQVLEHERVELDQRMALEQQMQRDQQAVSEASWRDLAHGVVEQLQAVTAQVRERLA